MKNILGVNGDRDFCQCCGKQGLRRVVWIEETNDGTISHYGTTCASKLMTNGKNRIQKSIYQAADAMLNEVCEKYWSISDKKEFDKLVAIELLALGADKIFADINHNIKCLIRYAQ